MNKDLEFWGKQAWIFTLVIHYMSLRISFLLFKCPWDTYNIELFIFYATRNISIKNTSQVPKRKCIDHSDQKTDWPKKWLTKKP